jgi:hypothetical protein
MLTAVINAPRAMIDRRILISIGFVLAQWALFAQTAAADGLFPAAAMAAST